MGEVALLTTKAGVLKYAESGWAALDAGLSSVWILQNPSVNTFRIVSRDETSQQYALNLGLSGDIIINKATETFLQFKLEADIYGLNFTAPADCAAAATAFHTVLDQTNAAAAASKRRSTSKTPSEKSATMTASMKKRSIKMDDEQQYQQQYQQPVQPESLRDKAAKEVLTSEQSYVKSLTQLAEVWQPGLKKLISEEDYQVIFGNIEQIRVLNLSLLTELEKRMRAWNDTQKIADVFIKLSASLFTIYKPYCESYDRAIERLQQVSQSKKSSSIQKFLKQAESQCGGFSLTFYLIMPVQRLARYTLLLLELLKKTTPDHPDYADLQAAVEMTQSVTNEINRGVGDAEKQKKLQDIVKRGFLGLESLLEPTRTIVLEGELDISGGALKTKANWGFLFSDLFVAATEAKQREVNLSLPLENVWLVDLSSAGSVNCFEIQTPESSLLITAKDKVTKERWFDACQNALAATLQKKGMAKTDENGAVTTVRTINYTFAEGAQYSGEWVSGKMQGQGKYTTSNGSTFEGIFLKGALHGQGIAKYKTGEIYEGEWQRDLPHGKGKLTYSGFKNGKLFEGEWEAGKKKGRGVLRWENGDLYDGEWDNDRPHGRGIFTKADGSRYDGEWKDGKRHGRGVFTNACTGAVYDGEWADNQQSGKGRLTEPSGTIYDGTWLEGRRHGQGVFDCGFWRYEGLWQNDRRHGRGTLTTMASPGVPSVEVYVGDFQFDRRSGQGRQIYVDGSVYEGSWVDHKRHGKGLWMHPNGTKYDGLWKDDMRNGQGVLTELDGSIYEGEWIADRRDGRGKQVWGKTGASYDGFWKNGLRQGEGSFTWPDGSKYTGQWIADRRTGQGKLETVGNVYEGEWKDDKREGKGTVKGRDGTSFNGEWKDDRKHGKGIFTSLGGSETEQVWKDGILIKPGIKYFAPDMSDPLLF